MIKAESIFHASPEELKKRFWDGKWNKAVRFYFYLQKGLELVNEFRYILMSIFAVYALLKLEHWWYMPLMFICVIPPLLVLGWISIFHMEKIMEYLKIQHATHWSRYNIDLQEKQLEYVRKIHETMLANSIKQKAENGISTNNSDSGDILRKDS